MNKEIRGQDARCLPKIAVPCFINAYKIKLRRIQRKWQSKKIDHLSAIMQWHSMLREGLIKTGISLPSYDKKLRRFTSDCRFNVNQVPIPFTIDCKQTYEVKVEKEDKRNHCVWVANPRLRLEKRQCTL